MKRRPGRLAVQVSLIYCLCATVWILVSDWLIAASVPVSEEAVRAQLVKGLLFVGVTGTLLFFILRRLTAARERHLAELEEAAETVRKLSFAVEQSPVSVVITDTAGRIEYVNRKFTQLTGYTATEVAGKNPRLLKSGELPPERYQEMWETIAAGRTWIGEFHNRKKNGELFWELAHIAPVVNPGGQITHYLALKENITEKKQAEARMRENEALTRGVLNSVLAHIAVLDRDGKIIATNEAWERFARENCGDRSSATFQTGVGVDYLEICRQSRLASADAEAAYEGVRAVLQGRIPSFELEYECHSPDRLRWFVMSVTPLDGALGGAVVSHMNITHRKEAEAELSRREEHFRRLIENASDLITVVNGTGGILFQSPSSERVLGYKPDELVGRSAFEFIHPWDAPQVGAALQKALAEPEASVAVEFRIRHQNGAWRTIQSSGRGVTGADGKSQVVVNSRDVTDQRALEEQLRQSQKMEAVGHLASGVAHDFNNLLTVISGHCELMQMASPDHPALAGLADIRAAAERAASLTRQLLAFSRQQVLEPRVVNLNTILAEAQKMLRRLIGEDVKLETNLSSDLSPVKVDPGQMDQVIINLVVNARDAMPRGGKVIIETRNVLLETPLASPWPEAGPGRYVMLAVTDTGSGIPPEIQPRIFEPFFTTKSVGRGTGLGLAVVHGIIKQSGGHIAVFSEVGLGTTFKICLPVAESPVTKPAETPAPEKLQGNETILLVEDEESVRQLAAVALRRFGYTVFTAAGGKDALEQLTKADRKIDLLVTDLVMPEMSGRALADACAARSAGIKVLYLSGYTDDAVVRRGILESGVPFLQKPFTPATLAKKVREALERP